MPLTTYLFIEGPVNRTGAPQGFSLIQISHKLNTVQNTHIFTHVKHVNIIRKLVPSVFGGSLWLSGSGRSARSGPGELIANVGG